MKKSKLDPLDYKSWGVERYGYTLYINPNYCYEEGPYVIDVENYKDGRFAGLGVISLSDPEKNIYFWNELTIPTNLLDKTLLIGHVLRTDIHKLIKWGIDVDVNMVHYDTSLIEHLANSTKKKYGLKDLVKEKFHIEYPSYKDIVGDGDFDTVPLDVIANYNGMDLVATMKLFRSQNQSLKETEIYRRLLWPLGFSLNGMEELGLMLNLPYLQKLEGRLSIQSSELKSKIQNELGDINLNSPKQVLEALNGKGIVPKYKGKVSIDKRGLRNMAQTPLISQLLGFSELETLLSSFVTPLLEQGGSNESTIHPFFSQTATRTGRLACYRPNLQQVPTHTEKGRQVKAAFVARPGHLFVELDYSAIEPRMLAHFSKSRNLCELFKSGINFHDFTADRLGIDRQAAKVLNLSTGYRATKYGVAYQLKCTPEEALKHLNEWWSLWPDLALWENNLISITKQKGCVETLLGRKIYIDNLDANDHKVRATAERRVIENLAQGSVSDIIGLAMIELHKQHFHLVNQIHDSVLMEIEEDLLDVSIPIACKVMESAVVLEVPLQVEVKVGENWGEMQTWTSPSRIQATA